VTDKGYFRLVLMVSFIVLGAVVALNRRVFPPPAELPSFTYLLPACNAFINGTCSILLLISLMFIRRGNIAAHKATNIVTFCLSSLFLISYVLFHYLAPETHYPEYAPARALYFFILVTHIILAAAVLPLILLSFYHGLRMNIAVHKKLVRWTWPVWLYVTITGVVVYLMISPYYPAV
jgi:putative membrane protein